MIGLSLILGAQKKHRVTARGGSHNVSLAIFTFSTPYPHHSAVLRQITA